MKNNKNNLNLHNNKGTNMPPHTPTQATGRVSLPGKFYMLSTVKSRFDEYARAALAGTPCEIGGLAKIEKIGEDYVCTDIRILPQTASGATFELDEMEVAKFAGELYKAGKKDELHLWNSLIHSHPVGTAPFLSGVDNTNIKDLAGNRHAWSIIMTAARDCIDANNYKVHYYQSGDMPFLVQDLPVDVMHPERAAIEAEVKEKLKTRTFTSSGKVQGGWAGPGSRTVNSLHNYTPREAASFQDYLNAEEIPERGYREPYQRPVSSGNDASERLSLLLDPDTEDNEDYWGGMTEEEMFSEITGIEEGMTVRITLRPETLSQLEPEDAEELVEMDGSDFTVESIVGETVLVNGFLLCDEDVELIE